MKRDELLLELWAETNLLAVTRGPADHDGSTACTCRWCKVHGLLRVLDDQFGGDLVKHQAAKIEAKRKAGG